MSIALLGAVTFAMFPKCRIQARGWKLDPWDKGVNRAWPKFLFPRVKDYMWTDIIRETLFRDPYYNQLREIPT